MKYLKLYEQFKLIKESITGKKLYLFSALEELEEEGNYKPGGSYLD